MPDITNRSIHSYRQKVLGRSGIWTGLSADGDASAWLHILSFCAIGQIVDKYYLPEQTLILRLCYSSVCPGLSSDSSTEVIR